MRDPSTLVTCTKGASQLQMLVDVLSRSMAQLKPPHGLSEATDCTLYDEEKQGSDVPGEGGEVAGRRGTRIIDIGYH